MTNKKIVLDASALLALFNKEVGHMQVEAVLSDAIMSSVNISEVIVVLSELGIVSEEIEQMIFGVVKEIIPFDLQQAFISASLRKHTKPYGLSFGDRACLSLAIMHSAQVLTADKIWGKLHIKNLNIQVIR